VNKGICDIHVIDEYLTSSRGITKGWLKLARHDHKADSSLSIRRRDAAHLSTSGGAAQCIGGGYALLLGGSRAIAMANAPLPSIWHLNQRRIPVPAIPTSRPIRCWEIRCRQAFLPPNLCVVLPRPMTLNYGIDGERKRTTSSVDHTS
jgi:hypothetical protein